MSAGRTSTYIAYGSAICVILGLVAKTFLDPKLPVEVVQPTSHSSKGFVLGAESEWEDLLPGQHLRRKLITSGQVPFLNEVNEHRLTGSGAFSTTLQSTLGSTRILLGTQGHCKLKVWSVEGASAEPAELELKRGVSAIVNSGRPHQLLHEGRAEGDCLVLEVLHTESIGSTAETFIYGDSSSLPWEKTAHVSDLLAKKVFLAHGKIPGLFQVSLSQFQPGAECEEHAHRTAAEVYVNYDGDGCHLKVEDEGGRFHEYDLTGGKVAIVLPGALHSAWNSARGVCVNFNMMVGPANE